MSLEGPRFEKPGDLTTITNNDTGAKYTVEYIAESGNVMKARIVGGPARDIGKVITMTRQAKQPQPKVKVM